MNHSCLRTWTSQHGWEGWREGARCELHAHEEGGEADKGGCRGAGIGAPGARHVGEHVVVRVLEGDAPLFVVAEFSVATVTSEMPQPQKELAIYPGASHMDA